MALTAAICTQCGAQIQVDESKDAGICPCCGTAFITEKVINKFITNNNFAGATINIQGGVDIENLYTLARRAVDANNKDDVLKYYGQIREREPNDWEATFFYAWYENDENFNNYFKIAEDLIFKLEPEQQIEAIKRICSFFEKISFTFDFGYGKESPLPLKDGKLYYRFVMRFFDEKNVDVVNMAVSLINYVDVPKQFYYEILFRQDKFYASYLQEFKFWIYRNFSRQDDSTNEWERIINEVEKDIEKLNVLLDSEEDKKNNYLDYYNLLIKNCANKLSAKNIGYLEKKIIELEPSSPILEEIKSILKYKSSFTRKKAFSILNSIVLAVLSIIGCVWVYNLTEGDSGLGNIIMISLAIANVFSLILSFKYSSDKKIGVAFIKIIIILVLAFIFTAAIHG